TFCWHKVFRIGVGAPTHGRALPGLRCAFVGSDVLRNDALRCRFGGRSCAAVSTEIYVSFVDFYRFG
ncbi:MAG: hypothetical protein AAFY59_03755, partial [Pseudomonadota bacterium]